MLRGPSGRRIAAILTLTVWVVFAGGDQAAEILAQALGLRSTCQMACCRKRPDGTTTRTEDATAPHGRGQTSESLTPASAFAIVALPGCGGRCCLQLGPARDEGLLARVVSSGPLASLEDAHFIASLLIPKSVVIFSFPARAPPA